MKFAVSLLLLCLPVMGEGYALLIGIGQYPKAAQVPSLDGPPYDVASIRQIILKRAGYKDDSVHMRVLLNEEATKANIVGELQRLARTVQPGDYVVFFYSGHGTSNGDPSMKKYGLDPQTGALLPADFRRGSPATVVDSLIVSKRDLRPWFTRIQEKATLLALFDTCYSQDAAKDVLAHPQPRYVPLSDLVSTAKSAGGEEDFARDEQTDLASLVEQPFPYDNVISLAAAARNQQAHDIGQRQLRFNPDSTVDHQPHGVFTNGLLAGLQGAADKNHDGVITHKEIYAYLLEQSVSWEQNPQMQFSKNHPELLDQPLFGAKSWATGQQPPIPGMQAVRGVQVRLAGVDAQMRERISRVAGITVTEKGDGDLLVKIGAQGGFLLAQGNGRVLDRKELSADQLIERLRGEPGIRELIGLNYKNPGNEVMLTTVGEHFPSGQTVFAKGQPMQFEVQSKKVAYFLLLDIDAGGTVTVVYPAQKDPLDPVDAVRKPVILGTGGSATDPLGMEFLKLFAFEKKPPEYDSWRAGEDEAYKEFAPGSAEFERLLSVLKAQNQASEIAMRIVTTER